MANSAQFRQGLKSELINGEVGEPLFTTDTKEFYIGCGVDNVQVATQSDVQLKTKGDLDINNNLTLDLGFKDVNTANLYISATSTPNFFINSVNGTLTASGSYCASDFIAVKPQKYYTRTNNTHIAFYNSSKVYISGSTSSGELFTTPVNCYFMRVTVNNAFLLTEVIHEFILAPIQPVITFKKGKNLYNYLDAVSGYFIAYSSGFLSASPSYYATTYIPVIPLSRYSRLYGSHIAFYNNKGVYISGLVNSGTQFTTPVDCYFVRMSVLNAYYLTEQLELGDTFTTYESHRLLPDISLVTDSVKSLSISLAPILPVIVGKEINIYFNNIMCVDDINNYQINVVCLKGKQYANRWSYVPLVGDIGDITFKIEVYQKFTFITSVTSTIKVIPTTAGTGKNPKTLIIGDSTTFNNLMITELGNLFTADDMDITFVGTGGISPNFHEGWSGVTMEWLYTDALSPFVYSGAFNFAQYLTTHSVAVPDVVCLNMGINDVYSYTDDVTLFGIITNFIKRYDSVIAQLKAINANVKIGVCVTVPAGNQSAFAHSNGCEQTSWRYNRNNRLLTRTLVDYYNAKTASNIYLIPLNTCLDTVNNIALLDPSPVNSRSATTEVLQSNGVHPGPNGYKQIADVYHCYFKYLGL